MKNGLYIFLKSLQRYLLTCLANSAIMGRFFLHWVADFSPLILAVIGGMYLVMLDLLNQGHDTYSHERYFCNCIHKKNVDRFKC